MMNYQIFYMLRDVLKDTMRLDLQYILDPAGDVSLIDQGLRGKLYGAENGYDELRQILAMEKRVGYVIHLQDRLHLNYFLFPGHKKKPPYCTVGPFLIAEYTDADLQRQFDQLNFTEAQREIVRAYLPKVPVVTTQQAFSVARHVLYAAHDPMEITVQVINQNVGSQVQVEASRNEDYKEPRLTPEEVYHHECALMELVMDGNYEKALKKTDILFSALAPDGSYDIREYLALFHWANSLYRKSAQDNGIPPYLVQSLYFQMFKDSERCTSYAAYVSLQMRMLTAYCDLCREYSTKEYSPIIRQIVNYIRLNLSQELDIQTLARNAGFSQTYITHKFKDEVGMPPVKFIQEQRIRLAKKMLATSDKPVSEIAMDVGVTDWSYFSRLFKKSTGKSPSEFRKLYDKS